MTEEFKCKSAMSFNISRRKFLALSMAYAFAQNFQNGTTLAATVGDMPYRTLGKTGEKVSLVGLGGYHIGIPSEEEGIKIIRTALDGGMNFLDNCWDYHNGASEVRMGKALRDGYRKKAFLMTKIDGRDKKTAAKQIDESLSRLQTDVIDLMQLHELNFVEEPVVVFRENGAMEALFDAKKAGKIRYIGFTGHKSPAIHIRMLEIAFAHGFIFDAVQMPLNVMDAHFDSFEQVVLPVLVKNNIGVLGMKPIGCGDILKSNAVTAPECLHYAMSLQTSVVITGCDSMDIVKQALNVARSFRPLTAAERSALLARTARLAEGGKFERYKSGPHFDGTVHHPEWKG